MFRRPEPALPGPATATYLGQSRPAVSCASAPCFNLALQGPYQPADEPCASRMLCLGPLPCLFGDHRQPLSHVRASLKPQFHRHTTRDSHHRRLCSLPWQTLPVTKEQRGCEATWPVCSASLPPGYTYAQCGAGGHPQRFLSRRAESPSHGSSHNNPRGSDGHLTATNSLS